jgi:hypothetical protein
MISPLFSQRKGIKPIKNAVQVESMDDDLRNNLWNALSMNFFDQIRGEFLDARPPIRDLLAAIWTGYFKVPLDTRPEWGDDAYRRVREYFFKCKWNEVYDFLEFVAKVYDDGDPQESRKHAFIEDCNTTMEAEVSGYRFVEMEIAPITSNEEITAIEQALEASNSLQAVKSHLARALAFLSERKSPDYPNSVKESISGVEALCNIITGSKSATLGNALDLIEKQGKVTLHPALKSAFDKLYGYASSSGGIRHGTIDSREVDFDIAKFMLVACSAFTNYLIARASKAKIKL